ncbi:hypothetical protein ABBQ38_000383 [Trebouxia sp. C0009 RCD-2024]
MHFAEGEEGRFELALSTSVLNELKYGSQLGRLAESLLLSAFSNNTVEPVLQRELAATLPSVKYISLAAFLNGGVVIRSSNLAVEGDVSIRAQAMGQSAARVAARQHSIFHGQKKPGEPIKYQELQEAWDQQQCTSTVSVPIPASRHFEDAFIPYRDRHKPPPDRGTCPVLYVANGTVGVIHFGLSTADVKLNGRQGKQFVGLAQSVGPHLGYLIAPALHALSEQIQAVAASNAQQQHLRRRSISCGLPPVETLTVHDSAGSLSSASGRLPVAQQQSRQAQPVAGHPPRQRPAPLLQPQPPPASSRMLSPFQTYTAAAAASSQQSSPDTSPTQQRAVSPDRPGSERLDLSPAKTALDMSMLEIARLNASSPAPGQPRPIPPIQEAVRRVSSDLARQSAHSGGMSPPADASTRNRELELEYQPSIVASPKGSGSFDKGKGKAYRRFPTPMLRASSPLSAYGSEPSGNLPRQLSIPGSSGLGRYSQQSGQTALDPGLSTSSPSAVRAIPPATQSPFSRMAPSSPPPPAWETSPSMQASGSTIPMSSLLPGLAEVSQVPTGGPWQPQQQQSRMSPAAAASLAASLPPQLSNSAMAVLSAPMSSTMLPTPYSRGLAALAMPSLLPRSSSGKLGRSPQQQSRGMLPPSVYPEAQEAQPDQLGYRLPPQLQSTSLLLQLLPAGSAQSLTQLMSRAASRASVEYDPQEPAALSRSASLANDNTTSVSVGSPKKSLLDMSRAVSEQLHLTSAGKGVQRPFLADLQERWTAGHQASGLFRFEDEFEINAAGQ